MPCCSGGSSRAPTHTSWSEVFHIGRTVAAVIPYPGFGRVELDVRMLLQFVGKDVVCCFNSVGGYDEVDVVQVGIQAFPGLQLLLCVLKGRVLA